MSPSVWRLCRKVVSVCDDDILPLVFPGQQVDGRKVDSFEPTFSPLSLKKERKVPVVHTTIYWNKEIIAYLYLKCRIFTLKQCVNL